MKRYRLLPMLLLLLSALPSASEEFGRGSLPDAPAPAAVRRAPLDKFLTYAVWPGYRDLIPDRSRLGRTQKGVLAAERLAFSFDFATTAAVINPRSSLVERNPMNTLWGNRNRVGILGSMAGWEMSYSYAAAVLPRWPWPEKWRKPMRMATILVGGFLIEEHVRTGVCNLRLAGKAQLSAADNCMLH